MEEAGVDRSSSSVFIQQVPRLLDQASDAERRYRQDWAVADIDERIRLLQEAISILETAQSLSTGVPHAT